MQVIQLFTKYVTYVYLKNQYFQSKLQKTKKWVKNIDDAVIGD